MNTKLQEFIRKQMLPQKPLNEGENLDEDEMLTEDELFEDNEEAKDKTMSEEDLKIESLKIATNIAKLMSDVTTDDIITIADKVSGFIRDHQIGSESSSDNKEESSDIADSLELPSDEENAEENKEDNSAE